MDHASVAYAIIILGFLEGIGIPVMYLRPSPRLARNVSVAIRRFIALEFLGAGITFVTLGLLLIHGKWENWVVIGYLIGTLAGLIGAGGLILAFVRRTTRASREA